MVRTFTNSSTVSINDDTPGQVKFDAFFNDFIDLSADGTPAAPSADNVRLFAYDAGGGKTRAAYMDSDGEIFDISSDTVSLKQFGATNGGDATAAMDAAVAEINSGAISVLYIPDGEYEIDGSWTITNEGVAIFGNGVRSSVLKPQSARDIFTFQSASPSTTLTRKIALTGFGIDWEDVSNPSTGCTITLNNVQNAYFSDFDIRWCFQGVNILGGHEHLFSNVEILGAFSWSAVSNSSFAMHIGKGPMALTEVPSAVFISNFNFQGDTTSGHNYWENGIIVDTVDGLFISNGHLGFVDFADFYVRAQNDAAAYIVSIKCSNVYFDGNFQGGASGVGVYIGGSATPTVKNIGFEGCTANIHKGQGIQLDLPTASNVRWSGGEITGNGGYGAIVAGTDIQIKDAFIGENNVNNGGSNGILVQNATRASICDNHVSAGSHTHPVGIEIAATATNCLVADNVISGHTTGLTDSGSGTNIHGNVGHLTQKYPAGTVWNIGAGDVTITHSSNLLTFAGAASGYTFTEFVTTLDLYRAQGINPGFWLDETNDTAKGALIVLDGGVLQTQRRATAFGAFEATLDSLNITTGDYATIGSLKSSGATAGIGYATGAGGAVTQATNKSTGVTLNKVTGEITLNNENMLAGTVKTFVVTNSAVAATDQIDVKHVAGGTNFGHYLLNARPNGAGSFAVDVKNTSAGALAEAIVIKFTLQKAVNS